MSFTRRVIVCVLFLTLPHFQSSAANASLNADESFDRITQQAPQLLYLNTSSKDYKDVFLKSLSFSIDSISSSVANSDTNEKATRVVQMLDQAIRSKSEGLSKIPVPRAVVFDDSKFIAFQSSLGRCFDIPVRWAPGPNSTLSIPQTIRLNPNIGISLQNVRENCVSQSAPVAEVLKLVNWLNNFYMDRKKTKCRISFDAPFSQILLTDECDTFGLAALGFTHVEKFEFPAAMNIITLSTGAIEYVADEEASTAMLAHELGHYYLHHAVNPPHLDYFYSLESEIPGVVPPKAEEFDLFGRLSVVANGTSDTSDRFAGQMFREELYEIAEGIVSYACNPKLNAACPSECLAFIESNNVLRHGANLPGTLSVTYKNVDQHLRECLSAIAITEKVKKMERPSFSLSQLEQYFDNSSSLEFWRLCMGTFPLTETLFDLIMEMNNKMLRPICSKAHVAEKASTLKIGYYTTEQEADLTALHILSAAGKNPYSLLKLMERLAELNGDPGCKKWQGKQSGNSVPLLNDYGDPHHETCFRAHYIKKVLERQIHN